HPGHRGYDHLLRRDRFVHQLRWLCHKIDREWSGNPARMSGTHPMKDRFCKRGLAAAAHVSRSFAKHDVGASAAIEFAVVAPLLIVLMIASVDLGMGFYRKMQVQSAAQAGAVYAMLHGFSSSSVTSAVTSATTLSGL